MCVRACEGKRKRERVRERTKSVHLSWAEFFYSISFSKDGFQFSLGDAPHFFSDGDHSINNSMKKAGPLYKGLRIC